jgi:hypothetical protein
MYYGYTIQQFLFLSPVATSVLYLHHSLPLTILNFGDWEVRGISPVVIARSPLKILEARLTPSRSLPFAL